MNPVQKANWYIESFLSADLSLERISKASCVSAFHLTRAFGNATGRSVMRYVKHRRLSEAAKRLAAGEADILALALESSYGSHEAFSRAFRDLFGVTPESVRRAGSTDNLSLTEAINMSEPTVTLAEPAIIEHETKLYAGIRRNYTYESSAAIPAHWNEFNGVDSEIPNSVGDAAFGVIMNDDNEGNFDYIAAFEVSSFAGLDEKFARIKVPAQRYAVFNSSMHVSAIKAVMHSIWSNWLPGSGHEVADAPMLERYGREFDPQTSAGGFQIWIPLKG